MSLLKLRAYNTQMVPIDAISTARNLVEKLSEQIPLEKAFLFGSGVQNRLTPDSDLDILVVLKEVGSEKRAYKVVGQKYFSPIAVDWIFKDEVDFEKRKDLGGVCFEAFHHGKQIYGY